MLQVCVAVPISAASVSLLPLPVRAAPTPEELAGRLEQALNSADRDRVKALMAPDQRELLAPRLLRFSQRFPDARWRLTAGAALPDGRFPLALRVTGTAENEGLTFSLKADQQLVLSTEAGLITAQERIQDQSVLVSASSPLPLTLLIPDAVLTGARYDVDVVLNEPLGDALVAAGLTALTPEQVRDQRSPDIQLEPMGGGGLFKSVQAPFEPGVQTWAAMLVHPDGVITVTKQVRVVEERSQL